jgi:hypothetical protein
MLFHRGDVAGQATKLRKDSQDMDNALRKTASIRHQLFQV